MLTARLAGTASVPSTPAQASHQVPPKAQRTSLFKSLYDSLPLEALPRLRPKPRRDSSQGIIAPPSPRPVPSPLPSPSIPGMRRNMSSSSLPPSATPPPPRRVSSDSPNLQYGDPIEITSSPEQFSAYFALGSPPKRGSSSTLAPSLRRASTARTEMRRVVSSSSAYDPDK